MHLDPIDLRMASVREARNSERRFCFEVITPHYTRVYQAPSEDDMRSWIAAINNALQSAFETKTANTALASPPALTVSGRKDIAAVLTGKSSSFSGHRSTASSAQASYKSPNRHATTGDKPTYLRNETIDANSSELLTRVRESDDGNRYCADCNSESKVEWVSINLGIVLCIECSGIHRSLGTHISKIRSLTLDTAAFTPDIVDLLLLIGNRVSNMIWEAKLDRFLKPAPHSTREQRLHFVTAKYADRAYVEPTTAHHSPDEALLTSIKRNEIQGVLHALADRANPDATDRSRATPAVFLALAAADPATPGSTFSHARGTSTSSISMPGSGATLAPPPFTAPYPSSSNSNASENPSPHSSPRPTSAHASRKPFPVAELLLQNGAQIPVQPAPIPLSRAALQYLEFKTEQRTGRTLGPGAVGPERPGGDGLGALPSFGGSMIGTTMQAQVGAGAGAGPGAGAAVSVSGTRDVGAGAGPGSAAAAAASGTGNGSAPSGRRQHWMSGGSSGFVGGVKALGEASGRR